MDLTPRTDYAGPAVRTTPAPNMAKKAAEQLGRLVHSFFPKVAVVVRHDMEGKVGYRTMVGIGTGKEEKLWLFGNTAEFHAARQDMLDHLKRVTG